MEPKEYCILAGAEKKIASPIISMAMQIFRRAYLFYGARVYNFRYCVFRRLNDIVKRMRYTNLL
jgi:hypothetical protein